MSRNRQSVTAALLCSLLFSWGCGSKGDDFCVQYCTESEEAETSVSQATEEPYLLSTKSTEFKSSGRNYLEHVSTEGLTSLIQPKTAFSLAFWYRRSTSSGVGTQTIFINGNNTGFLLQAQNKSLYLKWGDTSDYLTWKTRDNLLSESEWNHIVIAYNGETLGGDQEEYDDKKYHANVKIYFNGTKLESGSGDLATLGGRNQGIAKDTLGGSPFRVGVGYNSSGYGNFMIDEMTIWNVELPAQMVATLFNKGTPSHPKSLQQADNLFAWWRMGENEDTSAKINDLTGNQRDLLGKGDLVGVK